MPSVPPEAIEACRAQFRVANGMRDRDVPQPSLDASGFDAIVGELVAATVPQHVAMDRHGH
jgi:hypothetical protein